MLRLNSFIGSNLLHVLWHSFLHYSLQLARFGHYLIYHTFMENCNKLQHISKYPMEKIKKWKRRKKYCKNERDRSKWDSNFPFGRKIWIDIVAERRVHIVVVGLEFGIWNCAVKLWGLSKAIYRPKESIDDKPKSKSKIKHFYDVCESNRPEIRISFNMVKSLCLQLYFNTYSFLFSFFFAVNAALCVW